MNAAVQPLVQAHDLTRTFDVSAPWLNRVLERKPRTLLHAVDGVSFEIEKGKTLALVGESGCGKSTVARLLVGLYEPTRGGLTFDGQDAHAAFKGAHAKVMRRRIQMIFQDPYASLNPRWLVEDIVGEPLKEHGLITDKAQLKERVGELLKSVGLSPLDMVKYPHQFSGGQRQRISIARALATEPEFLVCDEPTSALDVSVQAQVLNIMKDLQRERQLTYLFISHNLAVVRHVSDQVGVMYLGRLVELADKHTLFDTPRHPYTRMLLDAIPKMHDTGKARTPVQGEVPNPLNPPPGCAFNPRCRQGTPQQVVNAGAHRSGLVAVGHVEHEHLGAKNAQPPVVERGQHFPAGHGVLHHVIRYQPYAQPCQDALAQKRKVLRNEGGLQHGFLALVTPVSAQAQLLAYHPCGDHRRGLQSFEVLGQPMLLGVSTRCAGDVTHAAQVARHERGRGFGHHADGDVHIIADEVVHPVFEA